MDRSIKEPQILGNFWKVGLINTSCQKQKYLISPKPEFQVLLNMDEPKWLWFATLNLKVMLLLLNVSDFSTGCKIQTQGI